MYYLWFYRGDQELLWEMQSYNLLRDAGVKKNQSHEATRTKKKIKNKKINKNTEHHCATNLRGFSTYLQMFHLIVVT